MDEACNSMRKAGFEPARGETPQDPKDCVPPTGTATPEGVTPAEAHGDVPAPVGTATSTATPHKYTVAVDFDGVIHAYDSPWVAPDVIPDGPVPGAIDALLELARSFEVVIHTTRGKDVTGVIAVRRWLWEYGYREFGATEWRELTIQVTSQKVPALVYIDDRAYRFDGANWPTAEDIHRRLIPWNKQRKQGEPSQRREAAHA